MNNGYKFYIFLKILLKAKLTQVQIKKLLILYSLNQGLLFKKVILKNLDSLFGTTKAGLNKQNYLTDILDLFETDLDSELFIFGLKLVAIKPLLLQEAKSRDLFNTSKLIITNPLSVAHNNIMLFDPHFTGVSNTLLSLIFFDTLDNKDTVFISSDTTDFLKELFKDAIKLRKAGVEPNKISMLMFGGSINNQTRLHFER